MTTFMLRYLGNACPREEPPLLWALKQASEHRRILRHRAKVANALYAEALTKTGSLTHHLLRLFRANEAARGARVAARRATDAYLASPRPVVAVPTPGAFSPISSSPDLTERLARRGIRFAADVPSFYPPVLLPAPKKVDQTIDVTSVEDHAEKFPEASEVSKQAVAWFFCHVPNCVRISCNVGGSPLTATMVEPRRGTNGPL